TMTKPTSTEKVVPITVGNPASAAAFAIDQSHMEDFATEAEENSSVVEGRRPPRGMYFTVLPEEKGKPMQNRGYFFQLEIPGRDPYRVTPEMAKKHSEEDVIRPILLVRYVTMSGEEALWPIKLTPPDSKANSWNTSAWTSWKSRHPANGFGLSRNRRMVPTGIRSRRNRSQRKCQSSPSARSSSWSISPTETGRFSMTPTRSGPSWRKEARNEQRSRDRLLTHRISR